MKKVLYTFLVMFVITGISEAANPDIKYPIADLGGCASQQECKVFCDEPVNVNVCISFAKNRGMIGEEEAKKMVEKTEEFKRNLEEFENSPGQCKTPRECDAYCRVEEHLDECLDYGVKYGHTTKEEAEKVRAQAKKGGPGGCKSDTECRSFCDNPKNADACLSFVVEEGKITKDEAQFLKQRMLVRQEKENKPKGPEEDMKDIDQQKVQTILKEMNGPGQCKTMEECSKYCSDFSHGEECMEFAVKNQIAPPEALEKMKKMSEVKSGPGGCIGPGECDAFCSQPQNRQECFNFTKEHRLMSEEEIEMMEREMRIVDRLDSGVKGPGGCMGPEECNIYCSDPNNIEECIDFSAQNGLIRGDIVEEMMGKSKEAIQKIKEIEGQKQFFMMPPKDGFERPIINNQMMNEPMSSEEFEKMKAEGRIPQDAMMPPLNNNSQYREDGEFQTFNLPEECKKAGAISPEACDRHMREIQGFVGSGCRDCRAQCPENVVTNCVDNRCVCGNSNIDSQSDFDQNTPPSYNDRYLDPSKDFGQQREINFEGDYPHENDPSFIPYDNERNSFGEDFRPIPREDFNPEGGFVPTQQMNNFVPPADYNQPMGENYQPPMDPNFNPPTGDYKDFAPMIQGGEMLPPPTEQTTEGPVGFTPVSLLGFLVNAFMIK